MSFCDAVDAPGCLGNTAAAIDEAVELFAQYFFYYPNAADLNDTMAHHGDKPVVSTSKATMLWIAWGRNRPFTAAAPDFTRFTPSTSDAGVANLVGTRRLFEVNRRLGAGDSEKRPGWS